MGSCGDEAAPWNPLAEGPLSEEEAARRARALLQEREGTVAVEGAVAGVEVVGSPGSDKENSKVLGVNKADGGKTYSKKNPVLVQKVLSFNKEEVKQEQVKQDPKVEEMEVEVERPWGLCSASGPDCPVHSNILPRTHWAFYSSGP